MLCEKAFTLKAAHFSLNSEVPPPVYLQALCGFFPSTTSLLALTVQLYCWRNSQEQPVQTLGLWTLIKRIFYSLLQQQGKRRHTANVRVTSHHEFHEVLRTLPLRVSFATKRRTKTFLAVHVQGLETPADVTSTLKRLCTLETAT